MSGAEGTWDPGSGLCIYSCLWLYINVNRIGIVVLGQNIKRYLYLIKTRTNIKRYLYRIKTRLKNTYIFTGQKLTGLFVSVIRPQW